MAEYDDDVNRLRRDEDINEDRMRMDRRRLFPLDELDDYEVADDDPDIRGWDVLGSDGEKIGEVEELIVDPDLLKVRYLDVIADEDLDMGDDERHLLIPIGAAQLDDDGDNVKLSGIDRDTLKRYPLYKGGPITLDYEHTLRESVLKQKMEARSPEEFYNDDLYNDDRFFEPVRRRRGISDNVPSPQSNMDSTNRYIRRREMD